MPRPTAALALVVCALATAAAVVSFTRDAWLGGVWVLLAGLTSNMAWYYTRRGKGRSAPATATPAAARAGACANRGACGVCVKQAC